MPFASKSQYFLDRARTCRQQHSAATDPSEAFAYGEMARRYGDLSARAHREEEYLFDQGATDAWESEGGPAPFSRPT